MADPAAQIIAGTDPAATALLASLGGRYRVLSELGRGGFGQVYLAEDELLRRRVAIKVLRKSRRGTAASGFVADTAFLAEARMVARMEHPGIVPIYDVVETEEGGYCIISRYVEGRTLREHLGDRRIGFMQLVEIATGLCEALNHAHKLGVVHRDVKPANIMLTAELRPLLLDFGLAKSWSEVAGENFAAGTPGYMSPEQARGEDHLVNNRSDLFSLGVVFYEMLTGQQAFPCGSARQQLDLLESGGPSSLRQIEPRVPKELERICLKAMQPQIRARYAMATDMLEDLRQWQAAMSETVVAQPQVGAAAALNIAVKNGSSPAQATEPHSSKPRVVPRGLRAFDQGDADFFLALVPGPRDRFGLPESLRFWKQRIETDDPAAAFRVGVLYGPSGCGKSSLTRAGLLPRCAEHMTVLFHEARSAGNAKRLAKALWQKFPSLAPFGDSPALLLQKLRHNGLLRGGRKLLIVIDQAEQWLRAGEATAAVEDGVDSHGETLAGLVTMDEPDLEEGAALLNTLRQCDGAQVQVLILVRDDFWRSVSRLLADADVELDNSNSALVDLFELRHAEMVLESFGRAYRCLPEDPASPLPKPAREFIRQSVRSLEEDRRVSPVRLALFAEMFRDREWSPEGLRQVGGVSGVAVTFLEETFRGAAARGPHRVHERAARQVLQLFVPETGDVRGSPCAQADMLAASGYESRPKAFQELLHVLDADLRLLTPVDTLETTDGQASWQLTHDHMVAALRQWLLARKADSIGGRAEIAMHERAHEWCQRPSSARLPGMLEWLGLRLITKRERWDSVETRWMMKGMQRVRLWGTACLAAGVSLAFFLRELRGMEHGTELASRVLSASAGDVNEIMSEGASWSQWMRPKLMQAAREPVNSNAGLNARLALLPSEQAFVPDLAGVLLDVEARTFGVICQALKPSIDLPMGAFQSVLDDALATNARKLRAFVALAIFQPDAAVLKGKASEMVRWLLAMNDEHALWAAHLRPMAHLLNGPLEETLVTAAGSRDAQNASIVLASLHMGDPTALVNLLPKFPPTSVSLLVMGLRNQPNIQNIFSTLKAGTTSQPVNQPARLLDKEEERAYIGQANRLLASLSLGQEQQYWPFLSRKADRTLRTLLVLNAANAETSPSLFGERLQHEQDPGIRQALLLTLSHYPAALLPTELHKKLMIWLARAYKEDPDGGIHSSIATLLRRWGMENELDGLNKQIQRTHEPVPGRGWWVTPAGVDMRIVSRPSGAQFAISAREVSQAEYQLLVGAASDSTTAASDGRVPAIDISWEDSVRYCHALTAQESRDITHQCYEQNAGVWAAHPSALERSGYRLPTLEEWMTAATSSPATLWDCGNAASTMLSYGWVAENAGDQPRRTAALLPNELGLWDVVGNASEWAHGLRSENHMLLAEALGLNFGSRRLEMEAPKPKAYGAATYRKPFVGLRLARSVSAGNKALTE